ncbi:MAG: hypothetical protein MRERV_20c052 [Mycoplasmataceae bacterium RV_VA103A]|nr:MAG: hypothetical protein MRERV_20c052 [Mycoplasmataceae bacterium RV_VA103A]
MPVITLAKVDFPFPVEPIRSIIFELFGLIEKLH